MDDDFSFHWWALILLVCDKIKAFNWGGQYRAQAIAAQRFGPDLA